MTFFILGCPRTKATGSKPVITVTVSDRGCRGLETLPRRTLGLDRSWLVLELKRAFRLGNLPLRPMGQSWWDRMVLGSGKSMGAGLGLLEGK